MKKTDPKYKTIMLPIDKSDFQLIEMSVQNAFVNSPKFYNKTQLFFLLSYLHDIRRNRTLPV